MFNKNKLKAKIVEKGLTMESLANILGINIVTLYRKFAMESDFTRNEIAMIKDCLNISVDELNEIFLHENLRKRNKLKS